ncbi:MAG: NAD(P)-binding domain-containing protein [Sandaracinaceae bacterium]
MSDVIAVVPLPSPVDLGELRSLYLKACLELYRAEWLRAFVSADGERMLCWFDAPDAETVRLLLRQMGSTSGVAWPVDVRGGSPEPSSVGRELVAVQLRPEPTAAEVQAAARAGLESAGLTVAVGFGSRGGMGPTCLVAGAGEADVEAALRSASITPAALWRCTELDPAPPALFGSDAPEPRREEAAPATASAPGIGAGEGPTDALDAVIIGAGLSGICVLERLMRMGLRVRVLEAGSDVGGVWYWNRYPGARVDSETYSYVYSFSDEVRRAWRWSELFASQPEVERYLRFVVDRLDLRRHMRFGTRVVAARYDERDRRWEVETDGGERIAARYLVSAVGSLSAAQLPDIPGIDGFAGESLHTARWPEQGVELDGRRVGVVGTGASGVQVVQTIAPRVRELFVYQRTPTYCVPQRNRPLSDDDARRIEEGWAAILASCHESFAGFVHTFDPRPGLSLSAADREARFEELWATPGFAFWLGNFGDLMMNREVNAHASAFLRRKIRARVTDPETARKLLPDHLLGTKRVPLENGYYEAFNLDHVQLVDLRETPIVRVTRHGIQTSEAEHALDVIVYATGFDAATGALTRIDIRGERGQTLREAWAEVPRTYLGMLVAGFPNLFVINGPQSAVPLCNAGRCIEQSVEWVARCLEHLAARGFTRIVPTRAAADEWTAHVEAVADATVLADMTNSWWFGANTPGKPRRIAIYAGGAPDYRRRCDEVARAGYAGCILS